MNEDQENRVRARAYTIWQEAGKPDGQHERHWQQALAELYPDEEAAQFARGKPAGDVQNPAAGYSG
jgi:hypothetical protein